MRRGRVVYFHVFHCFASVSHSSGFQFEKKKKNGRVLALALALAFGDQLKKYIKKMLKMAYKGFKRKGLEGL